MKKKIEFPPEYFVLILGTVLCLVTILWRINLASGYDPEVLVPKEGLPFYPDEISYYSGDLVKNFSFGDFLKSYFRGYPANINLWGNFIYFLRTHGVDWKHLLFMGMIFYIVFGIILMKIIALLAPSSKKRLFLYLLIMIHPGILQIAASWLRDIVLVILLMLSVYGMLKKNYFLWVLSSLVLLILRSYMVVASIFILLFLTGKNVKKSFLISAGIIVFIGIYLVVQPYGSAYLGKFRQEFIPRVIENFVGVSLWLIQGEIKPTGGLLDLEAYANYYYFATYFGFYVYFLHSKRLKIIHAIRNPLFLSAVFIGLYFTMLHSMIFGFFVSRIKILTWLMFAICIASTLREWETNCVSPPGISVEFIPGGGR